MQYYLIRNTDRKDLYGGDLNFLVSPEPENCAIASDKKRQSKLLTTTLQLASPVHYLVTNG